MSFFNNGLYACVKAGYMEDAKRLYRDGYSYLETYDNTKEVLDTLAEYHFQMEEYERAIYYDIKLIKKTGVPSEIVKAATQRLRQSKEQLTQNSV